MRRVLPWLLAPVAVLACDLAALLPLPNLGQQGRLEDGTAYSPTSTIFAVVDSHPNAPIFADGGVSFPVAAHPHVTLFFSAAGFDPEVDIASLPSADRLDLLRDIRQAHGLLLQEVDKEKLTSGSTLTADTPPMQGDFVFSAWRPTSVSTPNSRYDQAKPLGARQHVELQLGNVDFDGTQRITISALRARFKRVNLTEAVDGGFNADGGALDAGVVDLGQSLGSEGEVSFSLVVPVVAERIGESNLALILDALKN